MIDDACGPYFELQVSRKNSHMMLRIAVLATIPNLAKFKEIREIKRSFTIFDILMIFRDKHQVEQRNKS